MSALLELKNLSAGFPRRPVLRDIDFSLAAGEIAVLLGPNGSGKTSLLKTACGLLKPLAGQVCLEGRDMGLLGKRERARLAGFLFQNSAPPWPFTVRELLLQGRFSRRGFFSPPDTAGEGIVEAVAAEAGLRGFEDRRVTELSGGEYQRVLIARLLVQEPRILLLDEPVNNLDPKYQFMALDLISRQKKRGSAVLLSLHDFNLARRYADRVLVLYQGGLVFTGKPEEALEAGVLERAFEIPGDMLWGSGENPGPGSKT
jgi:iron complex transport system ATP-binding protein